MRMLLKVSMPVQQGNEAAKSGLLQRTLQSAMETLKPEAAYFYLEHGVRTSLMVFDMKDSSHMPATVEPLFQAIGAAVHLTPVMNGEDLQKGLKAAGM